MWSGSTACTSYSRKVLKFLSTMLQAERRGTKTTGQRGRPDHHVHLFRLSLFLSALPTALTVTTIMKDKAVADNGDKDDGDEANEDDEEEEQ